MFLKNQLDMIKLGFGTQAFWGFGPILWPSNKQEDDDKPLIHRGANPNNLHYDDRYGRV